MWGRRRKKKEQENPAQYLLDYLADLETVIARHAELTYSKKYLIYRDGYLYTGTDSLKDVERVVNNGIGLYTYKLNPAKGISPKNN